MTEGRDAATEKAFTSELTEHQCSLDAIKEAAMDMSPAFRSGFAEHLPEAVTVFDRYHVMASAGKATDEVRKEVGREEGGTWKRRDVVGSRQQGAPHGEATRAARTALPELRESGARDA
jgi:transposase